MSMGAAALVPPGHTSLHPCTILGIGAFVLTRSHHPLCSATSYRNGRGILAVCTPSTPQCFPCSPSKETRGKPVRGLRLAARRNKWPKHSSVTGILPFHPPSADRSRLTARSIPPENTNTQRLRKESFCDVPLYERTNTLS
jgi:hypothetical protein